MTDEYTFDDPGSLVGIKWNEHTGALVLITPREVKKDFPTQAGPADTTFADVMILDGPSAGSTYQGVPIYQKFLQGQLRANVGTGRSCLGRIGQDPSRAKPGQTAPWVLGNPSDADKQAAARYLKERAAKTAAPFATGGTIPSTTHQDAPPF